MIPTFTTWPKTLASPNSYIRILLRNWMRRKTTSGKTNPFRPAPRDFRMETGTKIADLLSMEKATRERGLHVVAIGGGTGLSTLLKGLKRFALTPAEMAAAPTGSPV